MSIRLQPKHAEPPRTTHASARVPENDREAADLSAIVDGLLQDAEAINQRNRQLMERVRGLQLMLQARQRRP